MRRILFSPSVALATLLLISCQDLKSTTPNEPIRTAVASGSSATSSGGEVGVAVPVTVKIVDKKGIGIGKIQPTVSVVTSAGAVVTGTSSSGCGVTDSKGFTTCYVTSNVAGSYYVKVNTPVAFMGGAITFTSIARILTFNSSMATTVASATNFGATLTVTIKDRAGTAMTTATNTVVLTLTTPNGATLSNGSAVAVAGVATFTTAQIDLAGTYTFTASIASTGATGTSSSFTVTYGTASKFSFTTQPSSTSAANVAFSTQPVVKVLDAAGNIVTNSTCDIDLALVLNGNAGDTLAGNVERNATSGVANFAGANVRVSTTSGGTGFQLRATSTICNTLTAATSDTFDITLAGLPKAIVLTTNPSSASLNEVFSSQPVLKVVDAYGDTVTTDSGTVVSVVKNVAGVTAPAAGGTLTGATSISATNGIVTYTNLNVAGTATADAGYLNLVFTATNNTYSPPITITGVTYSDLYIDDQGIAAERLFYQIQPQNVSINQVLPAVKVKITDDEGYLCTLCNNVITLVTNSGGTGVGEGAGYTATAVAGIAEFNGIKYASSGVRQMTASAAANPPTPAVSYPFTISNYGTKSKLGFSTQPDTTVASQNAFTTQPVVQIRDSAGNVVVSDNSTVVTITCSSSAAAACTLAGNVTLTAVNGVVTFSGLRTVETAVTNMTLQVTASGLTSAQSNAFD